MAVTSPYIAVIGGGSPYFNIYPWSASGFGAKFSAPGTPPTQYGFGCSFTDAMDAIVLAHRGGPYIAAYPWSGSGFGTKFSNPSPALPVGGACTDAHFTKEGNSVIVSRSSNPYALAWHWSTSGFGSAFSNPGTLPANQSWACAVTRASDAVAFCSQSSPFIQAYPWSNSSGFGSKFSNPGTLPAGFSYGTAFTANNDALAVGHKYTPFITIYPWSGSGFGTKFSDPSVLPSISGSAPIRHVAFSHNGDAIAFVGPSSAKISAYPWSTSGFGSKFSDPGTPPAGSSYGVAFTGPDDAIAVAHLSSPYVSVYHWSTSGFGSKFTDPTSAVTGGSGQRGWEVTFASTGTPDIVPTRFMNFGGIVFSSRGQLFGMRI
jgi:hypothetical protein